jgi:hypothetical protein
MSGSPDALKYIDLPTTDRQVAARGVICMAKSKLSEKLQLRVSKAELEQIEAKAAAEERSISSCLRLLVKAGMTAGSEQQRAA